VITYQHFLNVFHIQWLLPIVCFMKLWSLYINILLNNYNMYKTNIFSKRLYYEFVLLFSSLEKSTGTSNLPSRLR
jgi:hypothetical protein